MMNIGYFHGLVSLVLVYALNLQWWIHSVGKLPHVICGCHCNAEWWLWKCPEAASLSKQEKKGKNERKERKKKKKEKRCAGAAIISVTSFSFATVDHHCGIIKRPKWNVSYSSTASFLTINFTYCKCLTVLVRKATFPTIPCVVI